MMKGLKKSLVRKMAFKTNNLHWILTDLSSAHCSRTLNRAFFSLFSVGLYWGLRAAFTQELFGHELVKTRETTASASIWKWTAAAGRFGTTPTTTASHHQAQSAWCRIVVIARRAILIQLASPTIRVRQLVLVLSILPTLPDR